MQDDTLGISECGVKTKSMNKFLNSRTNLMNLQFDSDKCVKMHVGKHNKTNICLDLEVDAWVEQLVEKHDGSKVLQDKFVGRETMKNVTEKKYLGDLISSDGRNSKHIKERTNKSNGTINNIVSTLSERPYGKHEFKAYKIMREGLLLGGMLTNVESWINISKSDIDKLEKPDTILMRKVLSAYGNARKSCMMLELGIIPVRFVIMKKKCSSCTTY